MLAKLLLALIRLYQLTLSRLILATLGPICRFEPSCSRYAAACIRGHGALRGSLLSVKRLCRCHPLHPGGFDPPPPPRLAARNDNPRARSPSP
jgi:putative membrane protein insertion efficiency factor